VSTVRRSTVTPDLPPPPGDTLGGEGGTTPDAGVGPDSESRSKDVLDLLLHTEPDLNPSDVERRMGLGPASSNAVVGVRKVLHGATGRGGSSGTPALMNFGAAAYHAFGGIEDAGDQDAGDQEGATDEELAAAFDGIDVDGEL
jgi:hypothetical protein